MNTPSTESELPVDGDFAQLLERANRGDVEAQARICQHYEPKVRIIARVMLGPALRSHFDSMDLVQSVHRSLLVGLRDQKFDISSPQKLIALASTIVRRKVARKWRRTRKQTTLNGLDSAHDLAQTLSELSSPDVNPAKVAEFNDQVNAMCDQMSDIERRMLALRIDGFTWQEVGNQLGLHPVAARVRWTRLRQRLQQAGVEADWI
ncbi:MAG TPA: sigma-70 family RNA polymerase sigma factor [Pirellulaceae bacterium]|nr:sigma-70 family RNA polymerase sigma factor [Pirellulaceae bacterium]HMO91499.1 sigma-70 family RNA polymerase sigma factor [Pirellulaceae bacterium]HMP70972.1 sigma-70 family RNA polymerase sigma factor [Pirellulaceae bacterium]